MNPTNQGVSPSVSSNQPVTPVPAPSPQNPPPTTVMQAPKKPRFNKKFLGIVAIIILVIAVPVTLILVRQQQDPRQRASGPTTPGSTLQAGELAIVAGTVITDKDLDDYLREIWGAYYEQARADSTIRQAALDELIQKKLLEDESRKLSIQVSSQEINQLQQEALARVQSSEQAQISTEGPPPQTDSSVFQQQILEEKLKQSVVSWRNIEMATVFKDTLSPDYETQKARVVQSLETIRQNLLQGMTIQEAYAAAQNTTNFDTAIIIRTVPVVLRDDDWDPAILESLFSHEKDEVTEVVETDGGTFMVAKILDGKDTEYNSFEQWLEDRKSQSVITR